MSPRFDTGTSGDPGEDFRVTHLPEDIPSTPLAVFHMEDLLHHCVVVFY